MKTSTLSLRKYAMICCLLFTSYFTFAQTTIANYTFGGGLEGWTDGGYDAGRNFNSNSCDNWGALYTYYNFGASASSVVTSPTINLTSYSEITISFCNVNATNHEAGDGFDLQYFDGTSWTTIRQVRYGTDYTVGGPANSASYSNTLTSGAYTFSASSRFRFVGRCTSTNEWVVYDDVLITTPATSYCVSSGNTSYDTGITNVNFNTINNTDGSPKDNGYEDFTATVSTTVAQSSTHNLTVSVDTDGGYTVHTIAWIDWNQDFDFNDPGETYDFGSTNTDGPMTAIPITIPGTATLGSTRMRVSTKFSTDPSSCETGFDGEVEDYTVIVNAGTPIPEINLLGNAVSIVDGDTTPALADDTDFGSVNSAAGTNVNTFTIQNVGTATLSVGAITIGGTHSGDFTVTTAPASSVAAAGSTTFNITFDPSADGLRTANVSIVNGDSNENPYNFNIQGTGFTPTPEINIQGNANTIADGDTTPNVTDDTDFGSVNVTAATNVNTFTIQNTGTASLSVGAISITGTHSGDFTVTTAPGSSVAASGSTTFNITFDPSAAGTRTASVSIVNGDSDENPYNFDIEGEGFLPLPEINIQGNGNSIVDGDTTPTATDDTDFGSVNTVSGTNVNTFTIQNTGPIALSVGSITISGLNASDFVVTSTPASSVAGSGSTTFNITFDPSGVGIRTASVSIVNGDSDENPYNFDIQGSGVAGPPSYTAYYENFDATNGGWTNTTTTGDSWIWTNSFPTTELGEGSFWRNNNFNTYANNTNIIIQSPVIDLTGLYNLNLSLDVKCKTESGVDGMIIQYSIASGAWTTLGASGSGTNWYGGNVTAIGGDGWSGDTHTQNPSFTHSQFINTRIDLTDGLFSNQSNVRFRIQFTSDGSFTDDGVGFDNFRIEADPITALADATIAPANLTSNLRLWLKLDEGVAVTDGSALTTLEDQAYATTLDKEDANAASSIAPIYRDNATRNINFNPVADFDNSTVQYMNGKGGFYSQDYYVVFHSDDEVDTSTGSLTPGRQFAIGGRFSDDQFHEDPTGLGVGSVSSRYTNEVVAHTVSSFSNTGASAAESYGRAFLSATDSYENHPTIINVKTNTAGTLSEIYKNGKRIDNSTGISGDGSTLSFSGFDNLPFLLGTGRSGIAGRTSSQMNGMIAEVISYTSPNSALNQQKIQSYLALKYGVTLQSSSTGYAHSNHRQNDVDYIDSQGTVIWDTSANSAYNYDIAGMGRDDVSILDQKQSKSQNVESDGTDIYGPTLTSGFLTMGLTDIYDTNKLNQSGNATDFNDREFLVWGNNGADINLASSVITVNMSAGISPALTTDVSFTAMQRVWKVVETGGDIPSVKVRLPQNAIRNISPPGSYYMFISSTGVFDPTADYRIMTADGSGNLETDYDFDGTKYITFGYAPQVIVERSVYFDGAVDYIDMEDNLDLDPTGFTISAWIKRDAADSGTKSILSKRGSFFSSGYDLRIQNNNRIQMWWKNGSNQIANSSTTIPDDEWHHVAVIYNGATAYVYIDGVLSSTTNRTPPIATDESFYIAAAGKNSPTQHFRGNIDEVRVWDTALTVDQLRFVMNQEIEENATFVAGKELPTTITKNDVGAIPWNELAGYYPMSTYTYTNTEDASGKGNQGALRNLDTVDRQTAPLPYESRADGDWTTDATWENYTVQTIPNALSIVNGVTPIDWNIVRVDHDVTIDTEVVLGRDRQVLGLYLGSGAELTVDGDNADAAAGNGLTVSHYLKLDGKIDLEGQSQLVQNTGSDLDPTSSGSLEKDQQGTADVYTYNYWSSPVGEINATTNNNSYTVTDVMHDGVNPINWLTSGYNGSDGATISIADYWIWKFANQLDDDYSAWQHVRRNGTILPGEGYTMKGPGSGTVVDQQNYVFLGKPSNGDINLTLNAGNDYLIGNPYPSAIDANTFITDNGPTIDGAGADPLISGTLYFWEHWGGGSHNLAEYQGGYATYNFSGGVGAPSLGTNDPDVATGGTPTKIPGRYIPVSQGFFVVGETTGSINFNNGQRAYQKEKATGSDASVFVRQAQNTANADAGTETEIGDGRMKFRIGFNSVNTIHRQLLLTIDENTTTGYDWAFDAKIYDNQMDDLYWVIEDEKYTIQGSNEAEPESVYPLGIKAQDGGLNTITIDALENVPDDIDIFIHDIENDTYHNLRESDFQFFLLAGEHLNRFELTFSDSNSSLSVEDTELKTLDVFYDNESESIVLLNPNFADVKSIELFNIIGQNITTIENISELDYSEYKVKNLSTGTYIIKINTLSGLLSKKVLVK